METPAQAVVALWASGLSIVLVMAAVIYSLRAEKSRPADSDDDH